MLLEKIEQLQVTADINKMLNINLIGNKILRICLDLAMILNKMVASWKNLAKSKTQWNPNRNLHLQKILHPNRDKWLDKFLDKYQEKLRLAKPITEW